VSGFVLQGLQYVGITVETCPGWAAVAAGLTLVLGVIAGWLIFELVYIPVYRREFAWVNSRASTIRLSPTYRRPVGRFGWKFWHHE
jgi:hypothetical protein